MIAHKKSIRVITLVLVITIICPYIMSFASAEEAVTAPQVRANGQLVEFPDAKPFIDANNRTLIPVRFATEAIGADVSWNQTTRTAIIEKNGIKVEVPIGSEKICVTEKGKTTTVKMDTKAILSEGRTYVPIRFVAESLGAWVGFSDLHCTAQIYQDKLTPEEIDRLHAYYDMSWVESTKANNRYDKLISLGYNVVDDPVLMKKYGGKYGINNANEEVFHNASSMSEKKNRFQCYVTNKWYYPEINTDTEYALAFVKNSKAVLDDMISSGGRDKVTVDFKTDPSCIYHSKCQDAIYVRGVCTLTFADDYVISESMKANIECGLFPFTPEPGKTYTFDAEWSPCFGSRLWTPKLINLETRTVVKSYE